MKSIYNFVHMFGQKILNTTRTQAIRVRNTGGSQLRSIRESISTYLGFSTVAIDSDTNQRPVVGKSPKNRKKSVFGGIVGFPNFRSIIRTVINSEFYRLKNCLSVMLFKLKFLRDSLKFSTLLIPIALLTSNGFTIQFVQAQEYTPPVVSLYSQQRQFEFVEEFVHATGNFEQHLYVYAYADRTINQSDVDSGNLVSCGNTHCLEISVSIEIVGSLLKTNVTEATLRMEVGTQTAELLNRSFRLTTQPDWVNESHGGFTATIMPSTAYTIGSTKVCDEREDFAKDDSSDISSKLCKSIKYNVLDNDPVTASLGAYGSQVLDSDGQTVLAHGSVSENSDAQVKLILDRAPWKTIDVGFSVESLSGNFLKPSSTTDPADALPTSIQVTQSVRTADCSGSAPTAHNVTDESMAECVIDLPNLLLNDTTEEPDGRIRVTLVASTGDDIADNGYQTLTTQNSNTSVTVNILDDDGSPLISIIAVGSTSLTEGDQIQFKFTTTARARSANLNISYSITQGQGTDFLADNLVLIGTEPLAGTASETQTVSLQTENDTLDEDAGTVTVELTRSIDSGYLISETNAENQIVFNISDNDLPTIQIERIAEYVSEDSNHQFTLSTESLATGASVTVAFTTDAGTTNFLNSTTSATVVSTEDVNVNILNDNTDYEPNIVITVTLTTPMQDSGYVISSAKTTSFTVVDDDGPTINIQSAASTYSESSSHQFTISAASNLHSAVTVSFEVAQCTGADYLNTTRTAELFNTPVNVDVLDDDQSDEHVDHCEIMITLTDDDDPLENGYNLGASQDTYKVSFAATDDDPFIAFHQTTPVEKSQLTEGTDTHAVFNLQFSSLIVGTPKEFAVNVSQIGDCISGNPPTTVDISAGARTGILRVPIHDDDYFENNCVITATLVERNGYRVNPTDANASVSVTSEDPAPPNVVSIAPNAASQHGITEGGTIQFDINIENTQSLGSGASLGFNVELELTQSGGNFLTGTLPLRQTEAITHGQRTKTITIATNVDSQSTSNGKIAARVLPNVAFYGVSSSASSIAEVIVFDRDSVSLSLYLVSSQSQVEGSIFQFNILSSAIPATSFSLNMKTSGGENFIDSNLDRSVTISKRSNTWNLTSVNDGQSGITGSITVSIPDPSTESSYKIDTGATRSVQITVTDDVNQVIDTRVSLSLSLSQSTNSSQVEGSTFQFNVISSAVPASSFSINMETSGGDNFIPNNLNRSVTINAISNTWNLTTVDDGQSGTTGSITVSIPNPVTESSYKIDTGAIRSVTITVTNNADQNSKVSLSLSLSQSTSTSQVEGRAFQFNIISTPAPVYPFIIVMQTSGGANFIDSNLDRSVTISGENNAWNLITDDDNREEAPANITVSIPSPASRSFYQFGTGAVTSLTIRVTDNDSATINPAGAVISIEYLTGSVTEGDQAFFIIRKVQTEQQATANYAVRLSVSQTGNHIFSPIPETVSLDNIGAYVLVIQTIENKEDDEGGSINVTLLPDLNSNGYQLTEERSGRTATITIENNDTGKNEPDYSVASTVIESILRGIPPTPRGEIKIRPAVSIKADSGSITEGAEAKFTLTSSQAVQSSIKIKVKLSDSGNLIDGPAVAIVTIQSGKTSAPLVVKTLDNETADSDGFIHAQISAGEDYAIGEKKLDTVVVSDREDWLARQNLLNDATRNTFAQTVGLIGAHSLNTAILRLDQALAENRGTSIKLGGNSTVTGMLHNGIESVKQGTKTWQELLDDSSFEFGLFPESDVVNLASVWGKGDYRTLDDSEALDGGVYTGHLGFDASAGDSVVVGLSTSVSKSNLEYGTGDEVVTYTTRSTGIHPYAGIGSPEEDMLLLIAGYGSSEIELDQNGYETENLNGSFFNFGVDGEMKIYSYGNSLVGGTSELSINGESWMANQFVNRGSDNISNLRSHGRHVRISAVGKHKKELKGGTITPEISFGLREGAMNHQSFIGMELDGSVEYMGSLGYSIISKGEVLLSGMHGIEEWSMSGSMKYDSFGDRLGILLNLSSVWSQIERSVDSSFWSRNLLDQNSDSRIHAGNAIIGAEIGYGITLWDGSSVVVPYGGIELTQESDEIRFGSKLNFGSDVEFELENSLTKQPDGTRQNHIDLRSNINW